MLHDIVIFSILSSDNAIDFHDKTWNVLVKNQKYFFTKKYVKWFCNVPEEKYPFLLKVLHSFIKSFVNPFIDIDIQLLLIAHLIHFE